VAFSVYLLHKETFGIIGRATLSRRKAWFGSYITTILQRDVRDLANIEGLTILPRVLSLIAARAASLLNFSELSRSIAIPQTTLKRYMSLLETTFLFQPLPAWSGNLGKRLVKAPQVMLNDTGLVSNLIGLYEDGVETHQGIIGAVLDNFIAMEFWCLEKYEIVELIYKGHMQSLSVGAVPIFLYLLTEICMD